MGDSIGSQALTVGGDDSARARDAAHRPAMAVSGGYGHPLHTVVATVPIGAFVGTLALDIASKLGEGRAFGRPASWLAAVGVVSGVVAACFGVLDFLRITPGTKVRQVATLHLVLMDVVVLLFVVSFILRKADDTHYLTGTPVAAMVLSAVGVAIMIVGAFLGSTLVFSYGVRVVDEADQLSGYALPGHEDSETKVEAAVPESAVSESSAPESVVSESSAPESVVSESSAPESVVSESSGPEPSASDADADAAPSPHRSGDDA